MITKLAELASHLDRIDQPDLADRVDAAWMRLAQRTWKFSTGDEKDAALKAVRKLIRSRRDEGVSAQDVARVVRMTTGLRITDEEAELLLADETRRGRPTTNPMVEKVGEFVLDGGFTVEDIEDYTNGAIQGDEIVDLWKKFVRSHPEVRRDLLKRRDIVHAKPIEGVDRELRQRVQSGDIPESLGPVDVASLDIGAASGDTKLRMRSMEDLDSAAIETARLANRPEFKLSDGSPDVAKLAAVSNVSQLVIQRRLQRAEWLSRNRPTFMSPRDPGDRDAARDMASQLSGEGMTVDQIVNALNTMLIPGEEPWTIDHVWALFERYPGGGIKRFKVPKENWDRWQDYEREHATKERERLQVPTMTEMVPSAQPA